MAAGWTGLARVLVNDHASYHRRDRARMVGRLSLDRSCLLIGGPFGMFLAYGVILAVGRRQRSRHGSRPSVRRLKILSAST